MPARLRTEPFEQVLGHRRDRRGLQQVDLVPRIRVDLPLLRTLDAPRQLNGPHNRLVNGHHWIVAVMESQGVTHLASHDADFDRVPGITRYDPA